MAKFNTLNGHAGKGFCSVHKGFDTLQTEHLQYVRTYHRHPASVSRLHSDLKPFLLVIFAFLGILLDPKHFFHAKQFVRQFILLRCTSKGLA